MYGVLFISGVVVFAGAALLPAGHLTLDWLLLGATIVLDDINRPLLLACGLTWLLAALMCPRQISVKLRLGLVGVTAGNLLTLIAGDHPTLYTGFALMSLSAYTFFSPGDRGAGRVYMAWAMVAEIVLFAAMIGLQKDHSLPSSVPVGVSLLVILGFGVKVGLFPVHGTVPVSYRYTPLWAGVILAGSAINCGLLGWLRWLQPELMMAPGVVGQALTWLGVVSYGYAITIGFTQSHPRAILGYSSISQMALITIVAGAIVSRGEHSPAAFAAVAWAALYHSVAKSALFVASRGVPAQIHGRLLWWFVVLLAALSLSGMTFTAGALTKTMLENEALVVLGPVTSLVWISSGLSAALLTWFVLNVGQASAVRPAGMTAALLICAVALMGLSLWVFTVQPFDTMKWLQITVSIGFAASVVVVCRSKMGSKQVICGDLTSYLVQGSFWVCKYLRTLGLELRPVVERLVRRRLLKERG